MEQVVLERIKEFMKNEKFSNNSLAKAIDMPQTTLNDYMLGRRKCALALVCLMANAFPNLSMEWLLRGVGEMYLPGNDIVPRDNSTETPAAHLRDTSEREDMLLERIDMLKQKVQDKEEVIATLKESLANLNNHVADLRHALHYEEHSK